MKRTILCATLALGLMACGKGEGENKKAEPAPAAPTAPAATDTPPAAPAAPADQAAATAAGDAGAGTESAAEGTEAGGEAPPEAAKAEPVPTPEDFEEKAAKDVDKKNLESEVSKMEKELGIEAPAK